MVSCGDRFEKHIEQVSEQISIVQTGLPFTKSKEDNASIAPNALNAASYSPPSSLARGKKKNSPVRIENEINSHFAVLFFSTNLSIPYM